MENKNSVLTPSALTGTLTFMLTDLEGSTSLWEAYPQKMKGLLARHDQIIENAAAQNAGLVIKPRGEGDGRFVVFGRATDALLAADAIQQALAKEPWPVPKNIRVRIALNTGEAELRDGDFYGPTVNRCARLRSITHGGQTILTQVTYGLVHETMPEGFTFLDLGEHKLKDISRAERIYQLISPGLPADFPPLRTPKRSLQNMPVTLTSFIGRQKELVEVKHRLTTRRLITLSGPGGVGKTRLATQSASAAMEHFPDGGWMIDLTSIANPTQVTQITMTTLGIYEDGCCNPFEKLAYFFQDKKMLLILDNCEHVLTGVTRMVQVLLENTAQLTILATSREPLGVVGETILFISPLSRPKIEEKVSLEAMMAYEAVALFVERAAAVSDFVLTKENSQAVAQVCARLDGIPLALELAAARTKVLSATDLAKHLENQFGLLVSNQDIPHRQKTMRNLIDWSYDLLPDNERILLRRLSIFAGGWTLEAAEKICGGDDLAAGEILDLLGHLVDRSLVIAETVERGKRYRLLETIRQYGREQLVQNQETDLFAGNHAVYFTYLAEQSASELWGRDQGSWLRRLDAEHDNLRAALEWLASIEKMAEMMLRLAAALWRFWRIRGHSQEGRMQLHLALERNPNGPIDFLAEGLRGAGILALQQGDYDEASDLIGESLALYRQNEDKRGMGRALDALGEIAYYQGDYPQAVALQTQSLDIRTALNDKDGLANSLRHLGVIARDQGDYEQARQRLTQSLALCRQVDDQILLAKTLDSLGLLEYQLCNYDQASQLFSEAVSIYQALNDRLGISNTLQNLGNTAKDRGEFKQAKKIYKEGLKLKEALGDKRGIAQAYANLAELAFYQGKYINAAELASRSLALFQDLGVKRGCLFTLGLLAFTAQYNGEFDKAASLASDCYRLAIELNAPRPLAYCKEVFGLIAYAQGDLTRACQLFQETIVLFEKVGDRRNVASAKINLARTSYRQGDLEAAFRYIDESLSISRELKLRWTLGLGLEISGLLERSRFHDGAALALFRESLLLSLEQDNQQGVANCLGAIAGLAVIANKAVEAAVLFAAADKIRKEIGAGMGSGDQQEYDYYLTLTRQQLTEDEFKTAWASGAELTADQMVALTKIEPTSSILAIIGHLEVMNES